MNDNLKIKGHVRIEKKQSNGEWKEVVSKDNLVVNVGKEFVIDQLTTNSATYLTHFGVGSSLVGVSLADTNLASKDDINSTAAPHKAFTSMVDSGTKTTFRLDLLTTEPATQPVQLSEVGLYTAVSGGTMFSRVVHTPVTKTTDDEIRYYYDLEVQ